jgi:ATP-dependent helicase/DNAse subunit B
MFGWIKNMLRKSKVDTALPDIQPVDVVLLRTETNAKSQAEVERIRAHNRKLIEQAARKLGAHQFSVNPI